MSIRILNCGSMRPYFPRVENGITCLLIETNAGLVLVDTGLGLNDFLKPGRLMRFFTAAMRSPRDLNETAIYQIQRLGYKPTDVQNIIMTHLHLDHAGGLPDFPHAKVHIYEPEYQLIMSGKAGWEYIKAHWAHNPNWVVHELPGERWFDFEAIQLKTFAPEIWLVPLVGHTAGHCAIAVHDSTGWILHGGDAVPFNMAVDDVSDSVSKLLIGPHVPTIREFMKRHPEVKIVGAHMALDFYEDVQP